MMRHGCDCSRCQTEGCDANAYCRCCLAAELADDKAAIARVRAVCDQADEDGTALVWLADVRRALEGDA